jgi:hypothetical protein
MASQRAGLTAEGALYEAVARGNKDVFFLAKDPETATNPFETRYDPVPPVIHELRRIPPLNGAEFGRSCEFEFETAGDVFVSPTVLIDLPTWLPPPEAAAAATTRITNPAAGGASAGYTNGIAYFLFSKIQIFQDKLLLYEFSGDALWASRAARGTLASGYLDNSLAGWHDGSAAAISAAAAPPRLRLELPFVGGAKQGFPSIAMRRQGFKLRLHLRPLEEVVESSDPTVTASPRPWDAATLTLATSPPRSFVPLRRTAIAAPTLQLETRHIYTDGESQLALRSGSWDIPSSRLYENTFTFGPLDYAPLARASGTPAPTAAVTKRVDAQHPASRLFWFMRSQNDLRAGRRWKVTADISGGEYYANESLIIAGRDRETLFSPLVWSDLTHHAKEDRWPGAGLGEMCWDLGDVRMGISAATARDRASQPEGTVNFTTADRPTLYTELVDVPADTILGKPATEMTAVVDTWMLYNVEGDRGVLRYGN